MSVRVPSDVPPMLAKVPAFPPVALKLLSLLDDKKSNFADIAACIAKDPVLAGKMIKRANAADQPLYCEARDVLQAIRALGIDRTRQISLQTATSFIGRAATHSEVLRPCWNHTLACAIIASEIARLSGLRAAEAYTAGILHDIGRLGLLTAYTSEYEQLLKPVEGQSDDLIEMEHACFGIDHMDAGCWLARRWNLPESIVEVIAHHHDDPLGPLDDLLVVQIACKLADLLGFSVKPLSQPLDFDDVCRGLPESTRKRLFTEVASLHEAVQREIHISATMETAPPAVQPAEVSSAGQEEIPPASLSTLEAPRYRATLIALAVMIGLLLCSGALLLHR